MFLAAPFCFAFSNFKTVSASIFFVGGQSRFSIVRKKVVMPIFSVKELKNLNYQDIWTLPAYQRKKTDKWESNLKVHMECIGVSPEKEFLAREDLQYVFDLLNYPEVRKGGSYSAAYGSSNQPAFAKLTDVATLVNHYPKGADWGDVRLVNGVLVHYAPNGLTIGTLLTDEKVIIAPDRVIMPTNLRHLSLDYFVRTGVIAHQNGDKPIELLLIDSVLSGEGAIQKRIDQIIGDGEEYRRQVMAALPNERSSALMGGVGLSAGYHHHTKNFIWNLRAGVDHIWGKFRQTGPQGMDTENVPRLGWGITLGTGVDYKFTEKATLGLEAGVRLSEFKIPLIAKIKETKSSWFMAPYAQVVCGFYPTPDYSVSVFTGYFFPRTFSVKTQGTRIGEGTKCKVDGLFGGLRFARYF